MLKLCIFLLFCLSIALTLLYGNHGKNGLIPRTLKYTILLLSLLPISLRLALDFAKIYWKIMVGKDTEVAETRIRNTRVAEDLGKINYLILDKTGTITKN